MEGFTSMWEPLFAFAENRNDRTETPVRGLLTYEAVQWLWTHGGNNLCSRRPKTRVLGDPLSDSAWIDAVLRRDYGRPTSSDPLDAPSDWRAASA